MDGCGVGAASVAAGGVGLGSDVAGVDAFGCAGGVGPGVVDGRWTALSVPVPVPVPVCRTGQPAWARAAPGGAVRYRWW